MKENNTIDGILQRIKNNDFPQIGESKQGLTILNDGIKADNDLMEEYNLQQEQQKIEEMAPYLCFNCDYNNGFHDCKLNGKDICVSVYEAAEKIYDNGYYKVNYIVDEFVQRLKDKIQYRNDIFSDERPVFDEEYVDNIINIVADEIKERYK